MIPIDLENQQPGASTGLCDRELDVIPLTEEERNIVKDFRAQTTQAVVRVIPVQTTEIGGAGSIRPGMSGATESSLRNGLENEGFTVTVDSHTFERWILMDYLNDDVPYLTKYQGTLYYGLPSEGRVLGKAPAERKESKR